MNEWPGVGNDESGSCYHLGSFTSVKTPLNILAQMALHYISSMRAQKAAERLQQNIIGVVVPADIHELLDLLV